MTERTEFLGLDFDQRDTEQVLTWLKGREASMPLAYVVTPNVDHMVRLASAPAAIVDAYKRADLLLCDSRVLAKLGKLAGVSLTVVPGSDLTVALFEQVLTSGDSICFIGGAPGDGARLEARFPGVNVRHYCPPLGLRHDVVARQVTAREAMASPVRFTLLGVGSPQQELIAHLMADMPEATGTVLCIGASVDFILGEQKRAPRIVQKAGMEWAWRLLGNPRRLARRYLIDCPAIFPMVWRWKRQKGKRL